MKFSILGDSVSTFEGVSIPKGAEYYNFGNKLTSGVTTPARTWWGIVIDKLGGELLVNNSVSGSTVCRSELYEYASYGCSDERTGALHIGDTLPDVIIVYIGINDWGNRFAAFSDDKEDDTVFAAAYRKMLGKLKANYPDAEIWCLTPAPVNRPIESAEKSGYNLSDYCNEIYGAAREFSCRVIDLTHLVPSFSTCDGIHPDIGGMETIANAVLSALPKN